MIRTSALGLLLGVLLLPTQALPDEKPAYDLVIRNGKIVDGTGNPWYHGDLAISGGKIAALGKIAGAGRARSMPRGSSSPPASSTSIRTPTSRSSKTATPRARFARGSPPRCSAKAARAGPFQGKLLPTEPTRCKDKLEQWTTLGGYFDALEKAGSRHQRRLVRRPRQHLALRHGRFASPGPTRTSSKR